jgi:hypothetical protein
VSPYNGKGENYFGQFGVTKSEYEAFFEYARQFVARSFSRNCYVELGSEVGNVAGRLTNQFMSGLRSERSDLCTSVY